MHGREGEERKRRRHMWPAPAPVTAATTAAAAPLCASPPPVEAAAGSDHSTADSFLKGSLCRSRHTIKKGSLGTGQWNRGKDGREIHVGDCALFRADNSPPFIGLIRWFAPGKEEHLKLGVNWLYRPSDINLAKGTLLEAAPNEVFYSFHRDEISAESLLHPCKVAFLPKGVELPSGVSSFVCRRVYDTTNKCLWWLTDQDYINERQEEVDQLLDKTRVEMRAVVQSGGRSPKPLNGPSSTQLLKSGSDGGQNNGTSFPSQAKGKKRADKGDQGSESIKQECSLKADDGDSSNFIVDSSIKDEIAKITDKGGLINNDAVEKLVHLMQLDRGERKIDLAGRVLLADVLATTDRNDCLGRFVQLRGVPLLDDWLQEAHKGKNGDGSPKEGDKSIEELLLALLRALDKLPVNLNALQTCNIGKSVNHLRSHKNSEIQKKARSLVDAWKKRVDAEMTKLEMARLNDAKSTGSSQAVPWSGKHGFSGVSYGGNRRAVSGEVAVKNAVAQSSACKSSPAKVGHGDSVMKSNAAPSGSPKLPSTLSVPVSVATKDSQTKTGGSTGTSELPIATKEEKINGSSQSCSSDHAKTMGSSCKEEARNSTTSSMTASKASGGSSRHRKLSNGLVGSGASGILKDTGLGKPGSQSRSTTFEKASQCGLTGERTIDLPVAEHGSHRLIVRFPNPVRSPARSASGSSPEEPSVIGSRASSPGTSEKNEHIDRKVKMKTDVYRAGIAEDVKTDLWQNDDVKCVARSDDGGRSPTDLDEEHRNTDESGKAVDASRATCSSARKAEPVSGKSFAASLSSINALIESCIKYSEVSVPVSGGDDLGMNLLASVAAGEMSKSDLASPTGSPSGSSPTAEDPRTVEDVKPKISCDDTVIVTQIPRQPKVNREIDSKKHGASAVPLKVKDEIQQNDSDHMADSIADSKSVEPLQENKPTVELKEEYPVSAAFSCNAEPCTNSESKSVDVAADVCVPLLSSSADVKDERSEDCLVNQRRERRKASGAVTDGLPDCKRMARSPSSGGNESVDCVHEKAAKGNVPVDVGSDIDHFVSNTKKHEKEALEGSPHPSDVKSIADERLNDAISTEQWLAPNMAVCPEDVSRNVDKAMTASDSAGTCSEIAAGNRKENTEIMASKSQLELSDHEKKDDTNLRQALDDKIGSSVLSTTNGTEENRERKEIVEQHSCSSASHEEPPMATTCDDSQCGKSTGRFNGIEDDKMGEVACSVEASSAVNSSAPVITSKLSFDLNEGFLGDEGNTAPLVVSTVPGCSSTLHLPNMPRFTVCPMPSSSAVSITVAAPAKGPFVPPETLLKSKGELGWKGSAATSAFRPAEPRKVLEMPLGMSDIQSSDSAADKQCRLPLDIDLNVVDERVLEDNASQSSAKEMGQKMGIISDHYAPIRSFGGLDLDLNRADESTENGEIPASIARGVQVPLLPVRSASSVFPNRDASVLRDFDLNNGPSLDEGGAEHINRGQLTKGSTVPLLPSLRMNNNELGSLSSWFPPGNSYPAVAIPSFLPDRGDQTYPVVAAPGAQRMLGAAAGSGAFGSDLYRGPVLSSSPAMAFTPAGAFSYASFPFGSSFPLASASFAGGSTTYVDSTSGGGPCFPAVPTPLVGPAGAAPAPCVRPYLISLPEGSTSGGSMSMRKWGWQGFDLNAGPGGIDVEGRDERLPLATRQLPVANSQAFAEEQARIYQAAGGVLKRKEPEGGWDVERLTYKQPSWQ